MLICRKETIPTNETAKKSLPVRWTHIVRNHCLLSTALPMGVLQPAQQCIPSSSFNRRGLSSLHSQRTDPHRKTARDRQSQPALRLPLPWCQVPASRIKTTIHGVRLTVRQREIIAWNADRLTVLLIHVAWSDSPFEIVSVQVKSSPSNLASITKSVLCQRPLR